MIKVFSYLKSSFMSIILIIMLLIAQAFLDLELPDYTSRIINIGIQQNGIESTVPKALSEQTFNQLIMLSDNKEIIQNGFTKSKDQYELIEETSELKKELDKTFTTLIALRMQDESLIDQYPYMPDEVKNDMMEKIDEQMEKMPASMIDGTIIETIKSEYKTIGIDLSKLQTNYILKSGAIMLVIAFLIMAVAISIIFLGSRLASRLGQTLRSKVFNSVVGYSKSEMKEFGVASLITRTTNDVSQIQQVILMTMRVVVYAPIIALGGILKMTRAEGTMLWIIVIAVLSIFLLIGFLFAIVMPKFQVLQELIDRLNLVSREILTGLPVIRAFGNEKKEEKRFDEANSDLNKVNLFVNRTMSLMMPMMMLIMNVVCVAIVWYGAKGIDAGSIQVGDMMAYMQYAMQIIMSFLMISMVSIMLPRASISAKRVMEIIEREPLIKDCKTPKEFVNKTGVIEFNNVCFRYPDASEDVLHDINFTSTKGTTTAFIGSTGSGKSTLINLIPRLYDVTEGKILVDGIDIKDASIKDLRSKIGYVPQKGILFSGDVLDNIRYGNEKTAIEDAKEAARIAQATNFIEGLEGNYHATIAQGGTNVSGGQRQRLSIARAIAINPDIYIFDDSFSALDFKTDAALRKELKKVTKNSTVFIVAQRISTIMDADQIVVLDEGRVVGIGKHKELIKKCSVYKEIALSQLSEEELNA